MTLFFEKSILFPSQLIKQYISTSFSTITSTTTIQEATKSYCCLNNRRSTNKQLLQKLKLYYVFRNLFDLVTTQRQSLQETNVGRSPLYLVDVVKTLIIELLQT